MAALGACYLGIGAFTAATYALFMDLTDPEVGSTQFSAYMGATNLCESWSARVGGDLAARAGYPAVFGLMPAVSLLSLTLLAGARPRPDGHPLGAPPSA
jgi:predicted MFS family arabinose efflux permease